MNQNEELNSELNAEAASFTRSERQPIAPYTYGISKYALIGFLMRLKKGEVRYNLVRSDVRGESVLIVYETAHDSVHQVFYLRGAREQDLESRAEGTCP